MQVYQSVWYHSQLNQSNPSFFFSYSPQFFLPAAFFTGFYIIKLCFFSPFKYSQTKFCLEHLTFVIISLVMLIVTGVKLFANMWSFTACRADSDSYWRCSMFMLNHFSTEDQSCDKTYTNRFFLTEKYPKIHQLCLNLSNDSNFSNSAVTIHAS